MTKKIVSLLLFLLVWTSIQAQHDFTQVDKWMNAHAEDMGGRLVLQVYKDGKIVYSHSVNKMNFKQKMVVRLAARKQGKSVDLEDFTPTSKLQIASCSKWLSAALVMTFVDEGKLQLTDTVGKFLPVLSKSGKGGITISNCLSHMTGIQSPDLKEDLKEMKALNNMNDAIARIATFPMEGRPGLVFRYSNTGLQIAGAVLEKISGKSFEKLFAERIAAPLEMKNTDFGKKKVALPAGGASSTSNDYMNFEIMILNKGVFHGKRILSENSIAQMQINRVNSGVKVAYTPAETKGAGYGYGEWVMGNATVSSPGLFGSYPWVDNNKKYCAFLTAFYLKSDGRQEKYAELKKLVDQSLK